MTSFGKSKSIHTPMRDAERTYKRDLEAVGPGYTQDVIPYRAGFWRQNGAKLAAWALFQLVWWASVWGFFARVGLPEGAGALVVLVCMGLWFFPSLALLPLPIVWWRQHVRTQRALHEE